MLRDDDESEPEYDCPECGRTFDTWARLDDHSAEHTAMCRRCGREPASEEGLCFICRTYGH